MALSNSQLDKLGDRLRRDTSPDPQDVALYDQYRALHGDALDKVGSKILKETWLVPSGRVKTIESATAKLRRQRIRLSQVADIAGARVVVASAALQAETTDWLGTLFVHASLKDYRLHAQHGYRAVPLIVQSDQGYKVEIQIRTPAQNAWAILCEEAAASFGVDVKYGGGPPALQAVLLALSDIVADHREDAPRREMLHEQAPALRSSLRQFASETGLQPESAHLLIRRFDRLTTILTLWSGTS